MIGSLGSALAGVNLNGNNGGGNGAFSFHNEHASGSPFNLGQGQSNGRDDGWGYSTGGAQPSADTSKHSFALDEQAQSSAKKEPRSSSNHERQESIDLFLSQSPSQMLGKDVFKLSTDNLPGLALPEDSEVSGYGEANYPAPISSNSSGNYGEIRSPGDSNHRRNDSPPNNGGSRTSSSSRSNSPYNIGGNDVGGRGGSISAYQPQPVYNNGNQAGAGGGFQNSSNGSSPNMQQLQQQPQPSVMAPPPNAIPMNQGQPPQQQQQQPPPQVLYMAVPTPDGRGQVLQPVQMVQLPGKPLAYMVPNGAGCANMPPPGMMDPQQQQPVMMVAPPMQGQPPPMPPGNGGLNDKLNNNGSMGMYSNQPPSATKDKSYSQQDALSAPLNPDAGAGSGTDYATPSSNDPSDNLSALYSTPQRPPLESLLGQVRKLSRDQVGCRLVQQALDEEGPMAATLILQEGLPFWGEAMVDPFGNYLFQKILEKITVEERIMLVKNVSSRLVNASLNLHGTRSVQKVVELCAMDEGNKKDGSDEETAADILTNALTPAAARLCIDSHGNHVIQRILLKLGPKHSQFVFDAVAESVGDVARHRHGCCVIQRCLDSPQSSARAHLVNRIVENSLELMQDAYGNYVVQYVLDVCSDDDVHAVCESVVNRVCLLAIQKFSSNVMEKCLERCTDRVKEAYMAELSNTDRIRELMMDPFGNYVVQRALSVATHAQAIRLVESMRPHLMATLPGTPGGMRNGGVRNTAGGRRIMAKICRRFPNFTLNPVGSQEDIYSQNKGHHRHQQHPGQAMQNMPGVQSYVATMHHQQQQQQPPFMAQNFNQGYGQTQQTYNPSPQFNPNHNFNQNPLRPMQQFDQRQTFYDMGDTGYFQHTPSMGYQNF